MKYSKRVPYNTVIQKQLVVADRTFTTLKYIEKDITRTVMSIPSGSNYTLNTYFANDPYTHWNGITTPGTPGFFEWGVFYARYRVHAVKVKVYLVSNDATSTGDSNRPLMAMIHLQSDPSPSSFTSWEALQSLEGNRYTVRKPLAVTQSGGQTSPTFLTKYYNLAINNGNKQQYRVDDAYEGYTGSVPGTPAAVGPARLFNYYIGLFTMDGSNVTGADQNVSVMLTTKFYIEFKDRFDLT